jgi:hypothetical protein
LSDEDVLVVYVVTVVLEDERAGTAGAGPSM